jgi:hypothetical protein
MQLLLIRDVKSERERSKKTKQRPSGVRVRVPRSAVVLSYHMRVSCLSASGDILVCVTVV